MAVYFIRDGLSGLVKIGFSADPWRRLVKMQADCPGELSLVAMMDGGATEETALHARFAAHRRRGEWFAPDAELEELISLHAVERSRRAPGRRAALLKRLQDATGCSPSAVLYWFRHGRIPAWYWAPVSRAGIATLEELGCAAADGTRAACLTLEPAA